MTVSRGREFLSIPGPTNIPDAVLAAMHRPAIDIYAGDMLAVTHSLFEDLPKIFRTTGRTYIYAANGHGGWEAALTNVLSRGETVLVLESGLFALGWGDMARMMGVKGEVLKGDPRRAVDPAALAQRLAADTAREIKAILVVQIDTASGVVNDLAAIHRAIASVGHPALLMVDCVASLGCMPFAMDEWGLDAAILRHALLAEATRHAVSRWAEADALAFNIVRAQERANSVTTVLVQGREPSVLGDYCREKCGVVLGRGIGELQGRAFRIAHMGHVNAPMVFGVLGAIEMALGALGIPHGRGGLQAAVEYLGREVRP